MGFDSFTFSHTEGELPSCILPLNSEIPDAFFGYRGCFKIDIHKACGHLQIFWVGPTVNCMEEGERHLIYNRSASDPTKISVPSAHFSLQESYKSKKIHFNMKENPINEAYHLWYSKKKKEMGVLDSTSAENILHGKIRNKFEEFKISL